jgi:hypothetical protein
MITRTVDPGIVKRAGHSVDAVDGISFIIADIRAKLVASEIHPFVGGIHHPTA